MTSHGPFTDAVPRTLVRSRQANQILDVFQEAVAGSVLTGTGPGTVAMLPLTTGSDAVLLNLGGGESIWATSVAFDISSARGTAAVPVTEARPNIKVSRVENISAATMPNAGENQLNAAIAAFAAGVATSTAQSCAVMAHALGGGTTIGADVCAVNAQAYVNTPASTGVATGVYAHAQRDVPTAVAVGVEIRCANQTPNDASYSPTGIPGAVAVWINAGGTAKSTAAVVVANYTGQTFQAGYVIHGTNPVYGASFLDDGNAAVSHVISGSHLIGIDTAGGTFTAGTAIRLGGNQSIRARNVANTADWRLLGLLADTTTVGGEPFNLQLWTNSIARWAIDGNGHLSPGADDTYDLGTPALKIRQVTAGTVAAARDMYRRRTYSTGTALAASDFTLSAGWGTGATVDQIAGSDDHFRFRINAGSGSFAVSPTVTVTFKGGAFAAVPVATVHREGGHQQGIPSEITFITATGFQVQWQGTPAAGQYYQFGAMATGR